MRGKKTDIETKTKIIETKINNPEYSAQELWEKIWLSERTTSRILKEEMATIGEKSKKVQDLIDRNNELISLADKRLKELLLSWEERITARDLVSVRESWFKQNLLLTPNSDWSEKEFTIKFEL